jgi:putative ABC transport system permease protein
MLNYIILKSSLRQMLRKRTYFLINTIGLGLGIASFLILALYVYNDLTFNHFNKNLNNIYRVREGDLVQTKGPLLPKMLGEIPEVVNGTRIFDWDGFRLSYGDIAYPENIHYADTGFFSVFSFPFREGSARQGIHDKFNVVISSEFAGKYFGKEPALGKKFRVRFDNTFLQVAGVVDIPENSSIKFNILGSYETGETISPWIKEVHDWYNTFSVTYVQLRDGTKPESLKAKLDKIVHDNFIPAGENKTKLNLLSFREYHSVMESNHTLIIVLSAIALGILIIAIVNFINLNIAGSFARTKEIGIKRAAGASNWSLVSQMMTESLLVSLIALLIGLEIMSLTLPAFNKMFGIRLQFHSSELVFIIILLTSVWLIVGILSGLVPSIFWARTKLIDIINGNILANAGRNPVRFSLVIAQFTIAIILIAGTLLIRKQISFMINTDPKFDKENVLAIRLDSWQFSDLKAASGKYKYISEELRKNPHIISVCFSQTIPGSYDENYNSFVPEGGNNTDKISLRQAYVGRDYFRTYGIKTISGEGFDQDLVKYKDCVVLNETAMKKFSFTGASSQIIHQSSINGQALKVVGEVEDFSYQGVQRSMQPLLHFYTENDDLTNWSYLSVRTRQGSALLVIDQLKKIWENTEPKSALNFIFAIDKINEQYKEYITTNKLIGWFSILAVILSCMGLFALSSFILNGKTKEIGIRKVNGAKIHEVMLMLSGKFISWVLISFVISVPLSWYVLHKWLQLFPSRTALSWWIFGAAGLFALFIAQLTVSWHSWKAATRNPVESLRYE